ncbi:DNA partition complex ParG [Azotobacter chroococcum subsp. isscasi]|uniref:plasmid partition protein ParG n=1 Tax=Azotobacter chroococcum TaxID=353 RepID=UPI001038AF96|nr:plasmid partition protein ParG [Azotobacter chroococcum]TBW10022.1 DNA partition complex ParG [Azotobacter chroococcum subsp. isscasi]
MALKDAAKGTTLEPSHKELARASKGEEKRLNVMIDKDKHTRFRLACMRNGKTITDVVDSLIDDYLLKHP